MIITYMKAFRVGSRSEHKWPSQVQPTFVFAWIWTCCRGHQAVYSYVSPKVITKAWFSWVRIMIMLTMLCIIQAVGVTKYSVIMMTLSIRNMFRVTCPLWEESTGHRLILSQRAVALSFDYFLCDLVAYTYCYICLGKHWLRWYRPAVINCHSIYTVFSGLTARWVDCHTVFPSSITPSWMGPFFVSSNQSHQFQCTTSVYSKSIHLPLVLHVIVSDSGQLWFR